MDVSLESAPPAEDTACTMALRCGWTAVLVFFLLGLVLELLHLIKAPFYVDVRLRRELWTLAHAHGTLFGLMMVVFGATAERAIASAAARKRAAQAMCLGTVLMPMGFFFGGIGNAEGDPSLAIVLVPIGGLLILRGLLPLVLGAWQRRRPEGGQPSAEERGTPRAKKSRRSRQP